MITRKRLELLDLIKSEGRRIGVNLPLTMSLTERSAPEDFAMAATEPTRTWSERNIQLAAFELSANNLYPELLEMYVFQQLYLSNKNAFFR
jgi:hypothetical protein